MYCRTCGKELDDQAVACTGCGVPPKKGKKFCQNCGQSTNEAAEVCVSCGVRLASGGAQFGAGAFSMPKMSGVGSASGPKSRMVAGLLALLVGTLGLHKFYLGDTKTGAIMLGVFIVSIPLSLILIGYISLLGLAGWAIYDGYRIFTNQINEDALGNPLE